MPEKIIEAIDAEKALLGKVLVDPYFVKVIDLPVDDLYVERHQLVWRTLQEMDQAGRSIDFVTFTDALDAHDLLGIVGGPAYLAELINSAPFGGDAQEYVSIIRDRADRRRAVRVAEKLAKGAMDLDSDFERTRAETMDALSRASAGAGKVVHISDAASRLYDEICKRSEDPKEIYGLDTGFKDFNAMTAGLQKTEMTLLSGDPGVGKTIFAVQMASQMAGNGSPGAIFELEMKDLALVRRVLAAKTGIAPKAMRSGFVSDRWPDITCGLDEISALPIWLSDDTTWTTTAIRAVLTRMKALNGIEWFMVDHLLLLTDPYGTNDIERSNYISKSLRRICKDLDLAGLVVVSENKKAIEESGSKNLAHLAGAVGLSFDADMVLFMNRHIISEDEKGMGKKPLPNVRTVTFAKYREDTPSRLFHLVFPQPGVPAFADYTPEATAQRASAYGGNGNGRVR